MPSIFMSLGTNLIFQNQIVNLTYGYTYEFTCVAKNSRPLVSLLVIADNGYLNAFGNQTFSVAQSYSQCDTKSVCTTGLVFNLSFNDKKLQSIKTITCQALNTTLPYDMNTANSINVNIINALQTK